MIGAAKMAGALMLALALTGTFAVGFATPNDGGSAGSHDVVSGTERMFASEFATPIRMSDDDMFQVEDPGNLVELADSGYSDGNDQTGPYAIGLAARWGFIDDPAMAMLGGHWRMLNESFGGFAGGWKAFRTRLQGSVSGVIQVARDGEQGRLLGRWNFSGGLDGGFLSGFWERTDGRPGGTYRGTWNFTDGRPGGVFNGLWRATERAKGDFSGLAIRAPAMEMVPWDGLVHVEGGRVGLIREVRFEHGGDYLKGGDDKVFPQRERDTLAWRSSTTVNWDGLVMGLIVPGRDTKVVLRTEQWSREFTASELVGLHIRVPVDRMGHEIELRGFLIPPPRKECGDGNSVKVTLGVRWGYLDERERSDETMMGSPQSEDFATWDGFIEATRGAVGLRTVLDWERGGEYRQGNDDYVYPRDNRLTIEWRSSTTDDWDGIVAVICFPMMRGMSVPHVTIHTDQWTHVYDLEELKGLNETYKVDDFGHEVHVVAWVH